MEESEVKVQQNARTGLKVAEDVGKGAEGSQARPTTEFGAKRPGEGEGAGGPGEDKRKCKKRKPAEVEVVDQHSGGEDAQGVAEVDGVNPEDVGVVEQQGGGEMVKGGKGLNLTSDVADDVAEEMSEGEADGVVAHVAK